MGLTDNQAMTPNVRMEQISLAYVRIVAASAGFYVTRPELDYDSVDGLLMSDSGKRPQINFQAKATKRDSVQSGNIHFPLSVKNYNDLRADTLMPRILIILLMPNEEAKWISQNNDELRVRHCAYWKSLEGMPGKPNTSSVTVQVPTTNIFSSEQLIDLMQRAEWGDTLC